MDPAAGGGASAGAVPPPLWRTGITPRWAALELYRLWWSLTEIVLAVREFRQPHGDTDDTSTSWDGLRVYLTRIGNTVRQEP